jgi:hypothetical protein
MVGVVLIVLTLVLAGPVFVMLGGAVWSAFVGWLLIEDTEHASERVEGSSAEPQHA